MVSIGLTRMVILRDSGLAKYVVVLDNKMTLSFDLDLKANQATNDLIYYMNLQQLSLWHSKAPMQWYTFRPLIMDLW